MRVALAKAREIPELKALSTPAGLDEGRLSLSLSNLLYMENPYSYKKYQ